MILLLPTAVCFVVVPILMGNRVPLTLTLFSAFELLMCACNRMVEIYVWVWYHHTDVNSVKQKKKCFLLQDTLE
jgi:hypothetical protein